ncbi:MAG TPA: hypothetical protein VKE93_12530 [Candidatus Angelobacter sp.]|nr:hypothetical protein [Candidatus Angelobacter sp.]
MASRQSRFRLFSTGIGSAFLVLLSLTVGCSLVKGHGCALQDKAVTNMRVLTTAVITYRDSYHAYPPTLAALGPPPPGQPLSAQAAGYITRELSSGNHAGYLFRYSLKGPSRKGHESERYLMVADPIGEGLGKHHYFTQEDAVIRSEENHPATAKSPPSNEDGCICW